MWCMWNFSSTCQSQWPCFVFFSSNFADYGCMLEVQDVQYFPDGRSVVDAVGGRRFRVLSRSTREGYNTAVVKFLRDEHVFPEEQQGIFFVFLNCVYKFPPLHAISLEIFFIIYLNVSWIRNFIYYVLLSVQCFNLMRYIPKLIVSLNYMLLYNVYMYMCIILIFPFCLNYKQKS